MSKFPAIYQIMMNFVEIYLLMIFFKYNQNTVHELISVQPNFKANRYELLSG